MFTEDGLEKKKCCSCSDWQLLLCFNKDKNRGDGLNNRCKYCEKQYRKDLDLRKQARSSLFMSKTTSLAMSLMLQAQYGFEEKEEEEEDILFWANNIIHDLSSL
jgi:hypothetical protein